MMSELSDLLRDLRTFRLEVGDWFTVQKITEPQLRIGPDDLPSTGDLQELSEEFERRTASHRQHIVPHLDEMRESFQERFAARGGELYNQCVAAGIEPAISRGKFIWANPGTAEQLLAELDRLVGVLKDAES